MERQQQEEGIEEEKKLSARRRRYGGAKETYGGGSYRHERKRRRRRSAGSGWGVGDSVTGTKRIHGKAKQTQPLQCPERPSATAPLDRWKEPHFEPVFTPSSAKAAATSKHSFSLTS